MNARHGKIASQVQTIEGGPSACAQTAAGSVRSPEGICYDVGVGLASDRWRQLSFLPKNPMWYQPAPLEAAQLAEQLQLQITRLQTSADCGNQQAYTVSDLHATAKQKNRQYAKLVGDSDVLRTFLRKLATTLPMA